MFLKSTLPPRKSKYRSQSQIMPSSQKRSHRISVQNGPIERFTALTRTTFMTISMFMSRRQKIDPDPWNLIVTKLFAPKFCAEWSDREVHSSYREHFHDHFYVYVSGSKNWPDPRKPHCHKVVRTEILCWMVWWIDSQLSQGPFSW